MRIEWRLKRDAERVDTRKRKKTAGRARRIKRNAWTEKKGK